MRVHASFVVALWASVALAGPAPKSPATKPDAAQQQQLKDLQQQMFALMRTQAFVPAAKLAKQVYDLQVKISGAGSPAAESAEQMLASMLEASGDSAGAHAIYLRRLAAAEAAHGPDSHEVLNALGQVQPYLMLQGRLDELEPYKQRQIAIAKKLYGEHSSEYAGQLMGYGAILWQRGEYTAAVRTYEQVLAIDEANAKPGDNSLVAVLQELGFAYLQANDIAKAKASFDRALAITAKGSPDLFANMQWSVAAEYQAYGHPELGAPLLTASIDIYRKRATQLEQVNPSDPQLAVAWGMLSLAYRFANDFANAETYLRKADALAEKIGGPSATAWLGSLADLLRTEGKFAAAIPVIEHAQQLAATPRDAAMYDSQLAMCLRGNGQIARALRLATSYREQMISRFSAHSQTVSLADLEIATNNILLGDVAQASKATADALDIEEHQVVNALAIGTESDHEQLFAHDTYFYDFTVSFAAKFAQKTAPQRLALETALRRKGRVLDASAASLAALRTKLAPEDKQLLDELAAARAQLANLTVAGPNAAGGEDYAKTVAALEEQISKLELQLAQKSAQYRAVSQPITLGGIQKLVPKAARLVEIVNYQPFDFTKMMTPDAAKAPRRYAAYVLAPAGDPIYVDFGEAQPIDDAVRAFRRSVSNPKSTDVGALGHALYALTFGKLEKALGNTAEILIAPDGALNLVPFAALTDDGGKLLVERDNFTYLTSGRDLLRLTVKTKAQGGGVIFANPAFDATGGGATGGTRGATDGTRGVRSMDLGSLVWPQLPGTGQEADLVERTWGHFTDFRGERATEGALKALHGPRILHLATHGFFLPDKTKPSAAIGPSAASAAPTASVPASGLGNPLLRAGLALAGANKLKSGDDDGILTALEASSLDLWGTELVVLSACDTGNGKVTNGDGVYGLRRALVIAGAESLVMSLWQVDDAATRDLMAGYYAKLKAGEARGTALRDVQLELHKNPKYAHPFYWAAFLAAGDNSPL